MGFHINDMLWRVYTFLLPWVLGWQSIVSLQASVGVPLIKGDARHVRGWKYCFLSDVRA